MDGEIRAGTDALVAELQDLGVIVEDRLPDPALAEYGQVVEELWPMLVSAAERPSWGRMSRAPVRYGTIWRRWTGGTGSWLSWERFFATCDAFIAPAMPMRAWRVDDGERRVDAGGPADDSPQAQALVALLLSQASGCPMVVIPVGIDTHRVPFGIKVIGRRWHDEQLLAIAEAIAAVTGEFRPPPGV